MRLMAAVLALGVWALACSGEPSSPPAPVTAGDAGRGRAAMVAHGCVACHDVPGIRRAESRSVGPPLARFADRPYIAGVLVNDERNLIRWIMDPKDVDPETAMPDLGVTEAEARDMVAYLYRR